MSDGALHDRVVEPLPVVAFRPTGAPGRPTGSKTTDDGVPNDVVPLTTYNGVKRAS